MVTVTAVPSFSIRRGDVIFSMDMRDTCFKNPILSRAETHIFDSVWRNSLPEQNFMLWVLMTSQVFIRVFRLVQLGFIDEVLAFGPGCLAGC